jgi:hypothetical protein
LAVLCQDRAYWDVSLVLRSSAASLDQEEVLVLRLLGVLLLLASCSAILVTSDGVEIRIANANAFALDQVIVGFPQQQEDYGAIPPHGRSEYRHVKHAYSYAYVEVYRRGERLVLQPIDYVGESPLPPGRYTYLLAIEPAEGEMTLSLRREK